MVYLKIIYHQSFRVSERWCDMSTITLDRLEPGSRAIIKGFAANGPACRRMADMGLCPGAEIVTVRRAPLNDPIEFLVRGYNISLRKAEAASIIVEPREG